METLSPWREKPWNKLRIISLYKVKITTLRDTIWLKKKKLTFSFHSLLSSSLYIFSYSLYFSLLYCLLSLTQLFKTAPSPHHTMGLHFFFPSAQMAEWPLTFISSSFPLFFLSHSSHQVMQATYFDFASTKISFFSSHWPNGLACSFLFSSALP